LTQSGIVLLILQPEVERAGRIVVTKKHQNEIDSEMVPLEELSPEEQLKAIFESKYTPHPERIGPDGVWIIPSVFILLAMVWGVVKLIF